jgi:hypothetical protein
MARKIDFDFDDSAPPPKPAEPEKPKSKGALAAALLHPALRAALATIEKSTFERAIQALPSDRARRLAEQLEKLQNLPPEIALQMAKEGRSIDWEGYRLDIDRAVAQYEQELPPRPKFRPGTPHVLCASGLAFSIDQVRVSQRRSRDERNVFGMSTMPDPMVTSFDFVSADPAANDMRDVDGQRGVIVVFNQEYLLPRMTVERLSIHKQEWGGRLVRAEIEAAGVSVRDLGATTQSHKWRW